MSEYNCLGVVPQGVDNLLVPVCLSATHVAWGAVRLEPVWMQTGEAAGFAAALAKKHQTTPAKLESDLLVRTLVTNKHFVTFFNDLEANANHSAMSAAQYFGTKGFSADHNARLDEPLTRPVEAGWRAGFEQLKQGRLEPLRMTTATRRAERQAGESPGKQRGAVLVELWCALQR